MEQVAAREGCEAVAMEEEDAPVDADPSSPNKDDVAARESEEPEAQETKEETPPNGHAAPAPAACDDLNPEEAAAPVPAVVAEAEAPRSPEAAAPASADEVWVDENAPPAIDLQPPPDELEASFGEHVATIVSGVTDADGAGDQTNQRSLLLAMSAEWRCALVKLADRLHNMRTLQHMPKPKGILTCSCFWKILPP